MELYVRFRYCIHGADRNNFTFLFESEACSLTPSEEPRFRIRGNRMLGKIFRPDRGQETIISKWHSEVCHKFSIHQLVLS